VSGSFQDRQRPAMVYSLSEMAFELLSCNISNLDFEAETHFGN
jgi:hypothetical protein